MLDRREGCQVLGNSRPDANVPRVANMLLVGSCETEAAGSYKSDAESDMD